MSVKHDISRETQCFTENSQTAKRDEGKLHVSVVDPTAVRVMAKLEEYDQEALHDIRPEMIRKTKKVGNDWKGLFECPFCGTEFESYISNVVSGRQRSCGCAKGRLAVATKGTHGDSRTRLYRIWHHIQERCNTPTCKEYKWYGARGIKCEFASYEEFREFALSHGYNDDLTVERIDVNGNYAPDNITFIPLRLQTRNTRKNVRIEYKGLTLCASEWAEILGINPDTITKRKRSGWNDERIIETPVGDSTDISLVPVQIIDDIRTVRLFGIRKYADPDNWKKVEKQRYIDALLRHLLAYLEEPDGVDEESGIKHYKHMACNLAFICEMEKEGGDNG